MTTSVLEAVASGGPELAAVLVDLTEELYLKIEVQLIKAAIGSGKETVSCYKNFLSYYF